MRVPGFVVASNDLAAHPAHLFALAHKANPYALLQGTSLNVAARSQLRFSLGSNFIQTSAHCATHDILFNLGWQGLENIIELFKPSDTDFIGHQEIPRCNQKRSSDSFLLESELRRY